MIWNSKWSSRIQRRAPPFYQQRSSEAARQSLDHLLAMAQRYRSEGDLRQAADIWWTLLQEHADTPQAQAAQDKLLELAHVYEREGYRHQAARSMSACCNELV